MRRETNGHTAFSFVLFSWAFDLALHLFGFKGLEGFLLDTREWQMGSAENGSCGCGKVKGRPNTGIRCIYLGGKSSAFFFLL